MTKANIDTTRKSSWHVLVVPTGHETKARGLLAEWGRAEAYLPMRRFWKRETRKGKRVRIAAEEALYPGYLFFRCDLSQIGVSLLVVKSGASSVLMFDGIPAQLPSGFIRMLLKAEDLGKWDETLAEAERFASLIGSQVTIKDGVLAGFLATILSAHSHDKVNAETIGSRPIRTVLDVSELVA
jgi:transcription antitermination factor NusG